MSWVLAISTGLLAYVYAGYPALIWLLSRVRGKSVKKGPFDGGVAVLIAAHNEAEALPRKVENLLELAKREPIREIWIGLDGCTDGTGERVREKIRISNIQCPISNDQGDPRPEARGPESDDQRPTTNDQRPQTPTSNIQHSTFNIQGKTGGEARSPDDHQPPTTNHQPLIQILEFERRRGKAAVLNDLMAAASQPIFVMMDARQRVEAGAISKLLEPFADECVGVVSGALVYESADGGAQKGAASYWGYEKFIRRCESRFWAVPGATGALYAIRRELCGPIPENTLVDDVLIPMRAVMKGFRCLFEPSARVFDLPSAHFGQEGLRKRRTLAGIWQMGRLEPKIYSFSANPVAFQWFSHKFLRLLTPFFILASILAVGMMECWKDGVLGWPGLLFMTMVAGMGLSGLAYAAGHQIHSRLMGLLGAFWGVNWALAQAAWDAWTGRFEAKWKK